MPITPRNLSWQDEADQRAALEPMGAANVDMVRRVVRGQGPDKATIDPTLGARAAINISAVHVPAFCSAPPGTNAYKNTYDLQKTPLIGEVPPGEMPPARTIVDDVLSKIAGASPKNIYFAAIEVNGTGVRFYGDVCLILKADVVESETVILSSNSYDLIRPPITPLGQRIQASNLQAPAQDMMGHWDNDKQDMAALKTLDRHAGTRRRLTTGQVSDAVLTDEDYLEVLKIGSFRASELQEARVSAADAAAETQIGERRRYGPCPQLAESQWRKHRRAAFAALRSSGVSSRIVTTTGRVRG